MALTTDYNLKFKSTDEDYKILIGAYDINYLVSSGGKVYRELLSSDNTTGYKTIEFVRNDKIRKRLLIHRVMMYAFNEKFNPDLEVNHIDGNKSNNRIENLEVTSKRENALHAKRNFLNVIMSHGPINPNTKPVVISKNGEVLGVFPSAKMASEFMQINNGDVGKVCKGVKDKVNGFDAEYLIKE